MGNFMYRLSSQRKKEMDILHRLLPVPIIHIAEAKTTSNTVPESRCKIVQILRRDHLRSSKSTAFSSSMSTLSVGSPACSASTLPRRAFSAR